jgi:hypothetical protein
MYENDFKIDRIVVLGRQHRRHYGSDMRSHAHCLVEDALHRIRALLSSPYVFEYQRQCRR